MGLKEKFSKKSKSEKSTGGMKKELSSGYENNWVKTNEGDGFFVFFRFYSPTEAYYDKSWQLPMVERIE